MRNHQVCINGTIVFATAGWDEWVDYLFNLGITNPGPEGWMEDGSDTIEWWIV